MSALRDTLERTVQGTTQIVLMSGEVGIGASRLAAEIIATTAEGESRQARPAWCSPVLATDGHSDHGPQTANTCS
jgi:hypothetical protein